MFLHGVDIRYYIFYDLLLNTVLKITKTKYNCAFICLKYLHFQFKFNNIHQIK